jgi:hypothetical protein
MLEQRAARGDDKPGATTLSIPSHSFSGWQSVSITCTVTAASEVLSLLAVNSPAGMPVVALLDGVSRTAAAPEPSFLLVMCAGLVTMGAARLRKRSTAVAN